jgi:MFS family permease
VFILGVVVGLAIHSFLYGPQAAFITEQFSPRLRYTGSSLGYTIAGVFGGALAPLIFTLLLQRTGSWVGPALYLDLAVVLTLVGVAIGRNPQHEEDEEYLALGAEATRRHSQV